MWQFIPKWVWVALLATLGWAMPAQAQLQVQAPRAIWVWEADSYAMLDRPAEADRALEFFKRHGITAVYLYADAYQDRHVLRDEPERYAKLISRLHQQGFKVHALLGSWYLKTQNYVLPAYRSEALAMFQRVLDYNANALQGAQFDGINLDIEPHILDEWANHRVALLESWIDLSHAFMQLKQASGLTLQVGPAMPFWLDGIDVEWGGQRRPANEFLQDIYDYVTLMDYRDHADGGDGLLGLACEELDYGRRIGKPVQLGIETGENEILKVSFYHLQEQDLERELGKASRALGGDPAFGGFVIHHYGSYRAWLQKSH